MVVVRVALFACHGHEPRTFLLKPWLDLGGVVVVVGAPSACHGHEPIFFLPKPWLHPIFEDVSQHRNKAAPF